MYESDETRKAAEAAALSGDVEAQDELKREQAKRVGHTDSKVFWWSTYLTPLAWGFLFLMQLMKFSFLWMVTAGVCFSLSMTNAQGFYNCRRSHTQKLTQYLQEQGMTMFREATKSTLMPNFLSNLSLPSFLRRGGSGQK